MLCSGKLRGSGGVAPRTPEVIVGTRCAAPATRKCTAEMKQHDLVVA